MAHRHAPVVSSDNEEQPVSASLKNRQTENDFLAQNEVQDSRTRAPASRKWSQKQLANGRCLSKLTNIL